MVFQTKLEEIVMKERIENLRAFLDAAHSVYHANAIVKTLLEEDGYCLLAERQDWKRRRTFAKWGRR